MPMTVEIAQLDHHLRGFQRRPAPEISRKIGNKLELARGLAARSSVTIASKRGSYVEAGIEKRPYRRRDEQLAVDDVLRQRIFDELARKTPVVVGIVKRTAHGRKDKKKLVEIGKLVDSRGIGRTLNLGLAGRKRVEGHAVIGGQLDERLRAQAAFEVAVQMDLW